MRFKGRPILGAISGFFLGLWIAVLLMSFGVHPLDTLTLIGLPVLAAIRISGRSVISEDAILYISASSSSSRSTAVRSNGLENGVMPRSRARSIRN